MYKILKCSLVGILAMTFFVGCSDNEPVAQEITTVSTVSTAVTTTALSLVVPTTTKGGYSRKDFEEALASASAKIADTSTDVNDKFRMPSIFDNTLLDIKLSGTPEEKAQQYAEAMRNDPRYEGMEVTVKGTFVEAKANVPDAPATDESADKRLKNWLDGRDYKEIPLVEIAAQLWYLQDTFEGKQIATYYRIMTGRDFVEFNAKAKP